VHQIIIIISASDYYYYHYEQQLNFHAYRIIGCHAVIDTSQICGQKYHTGPPFPYAILISAIHITVVKTSFCQQRRYRLRNSLTKSRHALMVSSAPSKMPTNIISTVSFWNYKCILLLLFKKCIITSYVLHGFHEVPFRIRIQHSITPSIHPSARPFPTVSELSSLLGFESITQFTHPSACPFPTASEPPTTIHSSIPPPIHPPIPPPSIHPSINKTNGGKL